MKRCLRAAGSLAFLINSLVAFASPDLIVVNAKVFTADTQHPWAEAFAVKDGVIVQRGSTGEILRLAGSSTKSLDLAGKIVMPGLVDSHSHAIAGGVSLSSANMNGEELGLDVLQQRLREWRANGRAVRGEVLNVTGVSSSYWAKVEDLGAIFNQGEWGKIPIVLTGIDYHTAWANNAMLKRAGIDDNLIQSLSPADRETIGHRADFSPTGFLVDAGWDRAAHLIPALDSAAMYRAGEAAVRFNNSLGITAWMDPAANSAPGESVFNMMPTERTVGVLPVYKALADKGQLSAHVAALLVANPKSVPADLDTLDKVRQQYYGVKNLTLPGVKIFADGVLEFPAQSAAIIDPYRNSLKRGELLIDTEHFGELVSAIDARGWLVHIHAIGDRAVRESLNGIERARKDRNSGIVHSITHLQLVNPKEFDRFKELGVIASMQLLWATGDAYTVDMVKPYVEAFIYRYQYPARSLIKRGAVVAGASDWPISDANPWAAISQATTRRGPKGVLNKEESIDRLTMFYAYTINAARAIGLENNIGSIVVGKKADFIVLDRDVFSVSEEALSRTRVLSTYFEGREVYSDRL